jgi:hypothetical protein
MRFGWTYRNSGGPELCPRCQASAHEYSATFEVFFASIRFDRLSTEFLVGLHGSVRNPAYAGLRGFFLLAIARSRLRR